MLQPDVMVGKTLFDAHKDYVPVRVVNLLVSQGKFLAARRWQVVNLYKVSFSSSSNLARNPKRQEATNQITSRTAIPEALGD